MSHYEKYVDILEGLGFGSIVGDEIPDTVTYGEAVRELRNCIAMAEEDGEPLNVEVFGDDYDEPIPHVRKAYLKAKRFLKQIRVMNKSLTMN